MRGLLNSRVQEENKDKDKIAIRKYFFTQTAHVGTIICLINNGYTTGNAIKNGTAALEWGNIEQSVDVGENFRNDFKISILLRRAPERLKTF